MSTPLPDRAMIERLVAEVIGRLGTAAPAARPAVPASAVPAASASGSPAAATDTAVADRVITLAILERLPAGTRRVTIDPRAVVTPSARDHAKEAGLAIVRGAATTPGQPASSRPFLIATAACAVDPAVKAAAIARAVPGASRLPASGLADAVAALALQASRDAARGVLLTSRPALAVILANRSTSLRAVSGRDAATLSGHAAACAANLLVVDPASFAGGLDRLCSDFAGRPSGPIPAELATAPAGCGCTSHPH